MHPSRMNFYNLPTLKQLAADTAARRSEEAKQARKDADFKWYTLGYEDGRADERESKTPVTGGIILAKDGDFPPASDDAELQELRRELAEFGIDLSIEQIRKMQRVVSSKERAIIKKVGQRFPGSPAFYG